MPKKRQNLMFTATFPETILKLVRQIMNEPAVINVDDLYDDVDINQRVITVNRDKKNDLLAHLLKENDWKHVLIFCSAKRTCDNLVKKLEKRGVEAVAMHGNLQQNARARALREFKEGKTRILIATDVAGRGIDIEQLPCVINYELPRSPNDYTHRIGRTGRAGEQGTAISLISHQEYQHFGVIEKRNGIRLKREQIAGFEADAKAPEVPQRTQPKKKAKSKKRQSLVDKKVATRKNKLATESQIAKKEALAKKEKFAEKARAERKQSAATKPLASKEPLAGKKPSGQKESFYGKKPKTQEKASAETKSFYKEKPVVDDKQDNKPSGKATSERVFFEGNKEQDHKENKTADKPQPAGKSLYTRKLPKEED